MATILSDAACDIIKMHNRKFAKYANKGWMCEGGEHELGNGEWLPCNTIFNNDTEEFFRADYDGNILYNGLVSTPIEDAKHMAKIQGDIRKVVECGRA